MVDEAAEEAYDSCVGERNTVAAGRYAYDAAYDGIAEAEHVVLLEHACHLHDLFLVEDVGVLVERNHGKATGRRRDDCIHHDVVRAVVVVDVHYFFAGAAIHKHARYENDECARH